MCRFAQPAKHFPWLREIGKFVEYEPRRGCLTFQLAPPFRRQSRGRFGDESKPYQNNNNRGKNMTKSILILSCAAIAPFAFAQTSTTTTEKTTTAPLTTETTTTYSSGTVTT